MEKTEIDKVSSEVMKAGLDNKLKPKQIILADRILKENILAKGKKKTKAKIYQEVINPEISRDVADVRMSEKSVGNSKIAKTIIEVLKDNKITKNSTIIRHNNIIDKAYKINQLSTAEKGNSRFMEMLGMLEKKAEISNNITNITQININKLNEKEVNNKLLDIIKG